MGKYKKIGNIVGSMRLPIIFSKRPIFFRLVSLICHQYSVFLRVLYNALVCGILTNSGSHIEGSGQSSLKFWDGHHWDHVGSINTGPHCSALDGIFGRETVPAVNVLGTLCRNFCLCLCLQYWFLFPIFFLFWMQSWILLLWYCKTLCRIQLDLTFFPS